MERPPGDERVFVITGLTDGVFYSHLLDRIDGNVAAAPIRTADGLALALRWSLPVFVQAEVARFACYSLATEELPSEDEPLLIDPEQFVASFPYTPSKKILFWYRIIMVMGPFGIVLAAILLASMLNAHYYGADAKETAILGLVLVGLLRYTRWKLRYLRRQTIVFYSVGVRRPLRSGKYAFWVFWPECGVAGSIHRGYFKQTGLRFKQPAKIIRNSPLNLSLRSLPLDNFDPNWRTGEIGRLLRLYAPTILGIAPTDPEGGSTLF